MSHHCGPEQAPSDCGHPGVLRTRAHVWPEKDTSPEASYTPQQPYDFQL